MATNAEAQSGTTAPAESQPKQLGKYVIQRRLGAGGMGTVYLALDTSLNRTVALKVLPRDRASNQQLVKRFNSEGQSAAKLEHDHIVKVFDSGQIDGHLYLALEYVEGLNVEELVRKRGTLPVRRTIEIVKQVAAALQHAYERNIVHRDIKPSNLLIRQDGLVKLADMGLARVLDETTETSITRDGMTVGTVDFMSPEQASDSKKADIRSDLYSLGCTWYQMLTGQAPYPDGSVTEKLQRHHSSAPPDPRRINDRIPEAVVAVIHKLMAKKPNDRYQTPSELLDDLKQAHLGRMGVNAAALASLASSEGHHPQDSADDEPAGEGDHTETSGRAARTESPDVPQKGRYKPLKNRALPPRNRVAGQGNGKAAATKEKRELPPRSENPEALGVSQRKIDPELIKFGFFGLLALGVIVAVGYGIYSLSGFGDDDRTGGANPYLSQLQSEGNATSNVAPPTSDPYGQGTPPTTDSEPDPTPGAEVTDYQDRRPFPGAEDAQQHPAWDVPAWVYDERAATASDLKTLVVSGRSGTPGEYATLDDAFSALPREGGIIELSGRGPFRMSPQEFDDSRHLVLRAATGQQPVISIEQPLPAGTSAWLSLQGGRLRVSGVHLVASARAFPPGSACIAISGTTAYLHECTITLADPAAGTVAALRLTGGTKPTRCILETVLTRGNNLAAVATTGQGVEAVIGNSLFASGDAPVVAIANPTQVESRGDAESPPATTVRWLASAAITRSAAFALTHGAGLADPDVLLKTRRLALVAQGGSAPAGFRIDAWPQSASEDLEHPRAQGVQWEADQTYWIGWPTLVRMTPLAGTAVGDVVDESGWRQFWRAPADSRTFVGAPQVPLDGDHSRVTADAAAGWIGLAIPEDSSALLLAAIPAAPESLVERLLARSERPRIPEAFGTPAGGREVRIDLEKDGLKLDRILNGPECPDGARVVLTGSGRELIEPVVIRDKSLRIEFESNDDVFVVEPVARSTGERPEALIRVERGHIDLVGAQLRIPSSGTRPYPICVLQVVDGGFSIRNCSLQGALRDGAQDRPVVEWTRSADGAAANRQFALIENSFIAGRFQGIGGDLAARSLEIRNCVLFTLGRGVQFGLADGGSAGFLLVSNSTLSVSDALFQLSAAETARLHVFTQRCAFGPAVDADPNGPAVLVYGPGADLQQNIVWWDERSAYERQFTRFRIAEGDDAAGRQEFQSDWERAWGPDHIVGAVTGHTSVILAEPLPAPDKTTAASFVLKADSGAAQAEIGADPSGVGPEAQPAKATSNTPTPNTARPRNQPDF